MTAAAAASSFSLSFSLSPFGFFLVRAVLGLLTFAAFLALHPRRVAVKRKSELVFGSLFCRLQPSRLAAYIILLRVEFPSSTLGRESSLREGEGGRGKGEGGRSRLCSTAAARTCSCSARLSRAMILANKVYSFHTQCCVASLGSSSKGSRGSWPL